MAKLPEYTKHEHLQVEWRDAFHDYQVDDGESFKTEYIVKTSGYYCEHDEIWLHIAHEVLPEGDGLRGVTHIPLVLLRTINGEKV